MEVIGLSSKVPEGVDWKHYGVDLTSSGSGDQLKEIIENIAPPVLWAMQACLSLAV